MSAHPDAYLPEPEAPGAEKEKPEYRRTRSMRTEAMQRQLLGLIGRAVVKSIKVPPRKCQ
ncbi:hypothetical protein KCP77_20600 [Salmonella enterica subsp. enterica]|nr:hypothetical protein KCP77_20600 [Salmonella enterica subsp. enterica]